jgi:DNA-binding transcriptional LysR family regulator
VKNVDIRQLRYFVAIAEEGTITKAAKSLHIAQPPLSRQLKLIEEELGVLLFERNKKKKVVLTVQGELFLKKAKNILHSLNEAITEVKEFGEEISGSLAIGSTIYCAPLMLKALNQFRIIHSQVKFSIWEGTSTRLSDLLENRQIDIAITSGPFPKDNIKMRTLDIDPCVLVVPNNLKIDHENIDVNFISSLPLLLLRPSEGTGLYDQIINEFNQKNLEPNILCECHDSAMLLNLVSTGFGVTILPSSMVWSKFIGNFTVFQIKNNPWISEPTLVWRSNGYLSASAREFLQLF